MFFSITDRNRFCTGKVYGSIFRHVILKGISAQVTSAATRVNAGNCSVLISKSIVDVDSVADQDLGKKRTVLNP